ncbi:hypothetical protein FM996_03945 [Methylosinus sporium]|uniref:Uncharacterized protein n=1 Tax=Methylosinus sporium TaxID=428 RepID=A0A549T4B1_METSR|nr:hypothetical protein [Methylosinus sporium]TRL36717.1 hypothetical protein FM996_03945 [Methylosinus sporium]
MIDVQGFGPGARVSKMVGSCGRIVSRVRPEDVAPRVDEAKKVGFPDIEQPSKYTNIFARKFDELPIKKEIVGTCILVMLTLLCFVPPGHTESYIHHKKNTSATTACPAREAHAFFEAFVHDATLQKAFTRFPLKYQYGVLGTARTTYIYNMESLPFYETLHGRLVEYPGAAGAAETVSIDWWEIKRTYFRVAVTDDNIYYINYNFELKDGCWQLFSIENTKDERSK